MCRVSGCMCRCLGTNSLKLRQYLEKLFCGSDFGSRFFWLPPPDTSGSARRFSSAVTFRQGRHSAEALDGALRLATSFSYNNDASHVLFNSPFLRLPDLSVFRPPRIDSYETPSPPEHAVCEWLNNRAPRLIPSRHREYHPVSLGLVDYFNSTFTCPRSECSLQLTSATMTML